MHVLLATDAPWIVDEVTAAIGGPEVSFTLCRDGRYVAEQVAERTPDIGIFDLQIGTMGGMAVTMSLRLDESGGRLPHVPVLMLLDRAADLHLARRCGAEGWMVKPVDSLRLRRAMIALTSGGGYTEGIPDDAAPVEQMIDLGDDEGAGGDEPSNTSAEEEAATSG